MMWDGKWLLLSRPKHHQGDQQQTRQDEEKESLRHVTVVESQIEIVPQVGRLPGIEWLNESALTLY